MLALIVASPGFVPSLGRVSSRPAFLHAASGRGHPLMLLDLAVAAELPSTLLTASSSVMLGETLPSAALAFADQADNAAGPLFAGSLVPYLIFLYFVCQDVNGLDRAAKAGFASLLAFVTATVVASIVAKTQYGTTLANVDWLHASAESLLTLTNIADVVGEWGWGWGWGRG